MPQKNRVFLVISVLALFLLAGCTQNNLVNPTNPPGANPNPPNPNPTGGNDLQQTVQKGDTIQVNYRGTLEDGTEFDSSLKPGRTPLEFTVGGGQMIKGFDAAVVGMKLDEEKTVTLQPSEAYGEKKPELRQFAPKEQFGEIFEQLQIGQEIPTQFGNATIVDKNSGGATIDFNHKLAGKKLAFWIKIAKIQKGA